MRPVRGDDDLKRAAEALAWRLPDELSVLARLAYNYRWAWLPGGSELFRSVDPRRWRMVAGNPVRLLQEASSDALDRAANDDTLIGFAASLEEQVRQDLERDSRGSVSDDRPDA